MIFKSIVSAFLSLVILFSTGFAPVAKASLVGDTVIAYSQATWAQQVMSFILSGAGAAVGGPYGAVAGIIAAEGITSLAEWYANGHTDQELYDAYNQYVSDLHSDLGTGTLIGGGSRGGGLRIYWKPGYSEVVFNSVTGTGTGSYYIDESTTYLHVESQATRIHISTTPNVSVKWIAPFSCNYECGVESNYGPLNTKTRPWTFNKTIPSGSAVLGDEEQFFSSPSWDYYNTDSSAVEVSDLTFRFYVDVFPVDGAILPTNQDISINSRPSSITGDYGILGDDGTIIKVDKTIVDEGHSIVYNPVTNTTYNYTDYAYDYSDRSYNLTLEDGSTMKVVYGDENITIQEGDTIYNVYYLTSGSEGGSGSGGSGDSSGGTGESGKETIWDKIGKLFGTLGDGVLGMIEAALSKILDGLISLAEKIGEKLKTVVDMVLGWFDEIPALFGGFISFLGALLAFLPEEFMLLLEFGLAAVIFVAIINMLRRR